MRAAWLFRYRLPFQRPQNFNGHTLNEREGLIVRLQQGEREGFGEIAPLPGFSRESLPEATAQVKPLLQRWCQGSDELAAEVETLYPSVACGWSLAQYELDNLAIKPVRSSAGALLINGSNESLDDELAAIVRHGCIPRVIKVKVGRLSLAEDIERLQRISFQFPEAMLRLDGNRSWHLADVTLLHEALPELPVEFLEEPLKNPDELAQMSRLTGWGYALDEQVYTPDFRLQPQPGLVALVLKPMMYGSLSRCQHLVQAAHALKLPVVVSSSFESSLGITQLSGLAERWSPQTAVGLDTLKHFQVTGSAREHLNPASAHENGSNLVCLLHCSCPTP